jgi:hypothetical protein
MDLIASGPEWFDPRVAGMGNTMTGIVELRRRRCALPCQPVTSEICDGRR